MISRREISRPYKNESNHFHPCHSQGCVSAEDHGQGLAQNGYLVFVGNVIVDRMQAAFNACQSDENAVIEAYTATAKGMLSDKDLRKITRQSIHDSVIKVVVDNRAHRGKGGS
jgi:hypothetical protein